MDMSIKEDMPGNKATEKENINSFSTRTQRLPKFSARKPGISSQRRFMLARIAPLLIACLLLGFGGGWLGARAYDGRSVSTSSQQKFISNESELISSIAKDVGQSVVSIDVQSQAASGDIFGFSSPVTRSSAGTGFVVSDGGVIVTNRHVIPAGESSVSVTMADGTRYTEVSVIGRSAEGSPLDIAFLKIEGLKGKKLTAVRLGDSSRMEVGDRVIAIGNALGQFKNTVTSGIISGYGRDVAASGGSAGRENLSDLFQTDAAINEGNSGGPLVNINGEVIGVNTAVASGAQNIGFSIPINDIKGLIESVLETGELRQPYLGVRYVSLTADLAYQYNLDTERGAYILPSSSGNSIISGSPAEKAGLKEKDIIVKVEDISIDDKTSLTSALSRFKVGDTVSLSIIRDGKSMSVQATLEAVPGQ